MVKSEDSGDNRCYNTFFHSIITHWLYVQVGLCIYGCVGVDVYVFMCTWSCEIDATACSTSLTEESSGMEMDHMVTVTMVPDALALEKGIG